MKHSIAWHQVCYDNQNRHRHFLVEKIERLASELRLLEANMSFYKWQIDEALRIGKDPFDRERFRVPKSKLKGGE